MRLAHIINPVAVSPASDLFAAQPVTFATMRRARAQTPESVEVQLLTACYAEDQSIVPADLTATPFWSGRSWIRQL